jgi:quercetin 2,3-dioxygenase
MISLFPFQSLGGADHGWLKTKYHFSFANYYDPNKMGFGVLRVINDDIIAPGTGFAPHPHRDMEIITFVRAGAISHEDNQGNKGRTVTGDVQVMSAGTGITHAEYNHEAVPTHIFQIWIKPHTMGVKPRWESRSFRDATQAKLVPLVSGREDDIKNGALFIYQDAAIFGVNILKGQEITHLLKHQGYILLSSGELVVEGQTLRQGDGASVTDTGSVTLKAAADTEVLVIDVPK